MSSTDISDRKVIACGVFLEGYPRYDTEWQALSRLNLKRLIDLREKVDVNTPASVGKIVGVFQKFITPFTALFHRLRYIVSIVRAARREKADVIFVFPGNFLLTICLGIIKMYHRGKVYFDLYTSAYSAVKTHTPGFFRETRAYCAEFWAGHLADHIICLTPEYSEFYCNFYKIRTQKFSVVHDGVQSIWFDHPVKPAQGIRKSKRVLYWGNYLVHHGLDMVLEAAVRLQNEPVEFVFCGRGVGEPAIREEAQRRNLKNVVFKGFIPTTEELIDVVDSANITLGHLRDIHDIRLSAANKAMQAMARRKPVITVWTQQQEDLYKTKGNPYPPVVQISSDVDALIAAIKDLIAHPDRALKIGENARAMVEKLHSIAALVPEMESAISLGHRKR